MCSHKREKLTIIEVAGKFADDATAEQWFIDNRWGDGVECPHCNSKRVTERKTAKRSWRCKDCRKDFSTKTGTIMHGSNIGFRKWALAIYLLTTSLKGIASTKLASDLGIRQSSAWYLAMRLREAHNNEQVTLCDVVEVDETYIGGKERNKHAHKRIKGSQGGAHKAVVMGMKQRGGRIKAMPIASTTMRHTHTPIYENVRLGSRLYTDDARHWTGGVRGYRHESVNHSVREYVRGMAHTNGIESFWALLKRGYYGTHHSMSRKHLGRYVNEFAWRHNHRKQDTIEGMASTAGAMKGKVLGYKRLTA